MPNNNTAKKLPPRNVPCRDDKYMGLAFFHSSFSKDNSTRMGTVIVSQNNEIISTGYNGPPPKIVDTAINWDRPFKYLFCRHSEQSAIDFAKEDTEGSTLYVTGKPCSACMLSIVAAKIKKVIYYPHKTTDKNSMFSNGTIGQDTDEIARLGGVELKKFDGNLNWIRDEVKHWENLGIFE